ncbi:MAG: co-chaperone GroES [Gemmatimonas sp.]
MNFRPLHDHVIVEAATVDSAKTKGGILLPDTAKEKPLQGKVIAVGSGYRSKDGKVMGLAVKKGDRVIYGKWSGTEIKVEDKEYLVLKERDILGVVEGDAKVSVRAKGEGAGGHSHAAACTLDHVHDEDCCD